MTSPAERYAESQERHRARLVEVQEAMRRVVVGRIVSFLTAVLPMVLIYDLPVRYLITVGISVASAAVFVRLVSQHRRLRMAQLRAEAGIRVATDGLARLDRDWTRMAEVRDRGGIEIPELSESRTRDPEHPYVEDLDLYGSVSIRALLGPTPSPTGTRTLRAWLESPGDPADLPGRQAAVAAIGADFQVRESLYLEAMLVDRVRPGAWGRFVEWLRAPSMWGAGGLPQWAPTVATILPLMTMTAAILRLVGAPIPNAVWAGLLTVQAVLAWLWKDAVTRYFIQLGLGAEGLRRFHKLIAAWENAPLDDPWIAARRERLRGEGGLGASEEIKVLERALDMAESRASQFHVVVAVAFLWDIHTLVRLERWRERVAGHVEDWFGALGELEAAAALAALPHDNPDWCWPEINSDPDATPGFEADDLGHPLLSAREGRGNDVALDGPGRFLLVTGSNMSGKSTLLRSIALAAVLGQAGAPVCARRCRMTPVSTFTSMRLADSLASGVSLFMAELQRLKALVDAAPDADAKGPALLYLVDEVLAGTNSEERRIAAQRIITHLLSRRAIGAVTTHDLALHEEPVLDAAATRVHFRETIGAPGEAMLSFDYVLRPGLATSRNALKLLEVVGLGELDAGPRPGPSPSDPASTP